MIFLIQSPAGKTFFWKSLCQLKRITAAKNMPPGFVQTAIFSGKGFENFTKHLSSREHEQNAPQMDEDALALATYVFWDIKRCPVPPDCDARRVLPRIKHYLEDLGYYGLLTINAIGRLTDIPDGVLQAVSSTGICLTHVAFESNDFMNALYQWAFSNPISANMMVICPYSEHYDLVKQEFGYNIIELFPSSYSDSLWENFLLEGSGTLEEDKCSETGEHASWVCSVCDIPGKGFEKFTTHFKTREHTEEMPSCISTVPYCWSDERGEVVVDAREVRLPDSFPENASTMVVSEDLDQRIIEVIDEPLNEMINQHN